MYSILLWMLRFSCAIGAVDSGSLMKARAKERAKSQKPPALRRAIHDDPVRGLKLLLPANRINDC
ncbi:hypothetical protein SAMN05216236_13454 [Sedimentitalea nanhaiensis]|uniref:Uncharacterized protein n=1 Tax=Sedimentitalea nanhaiensis TaxID=999627 RepID=A0A1I7DU45_9RHOB|nr:hypothetical protein SAMN05216236_13454 [Sedimentitalea nanhaiensis]